MRYLDDITQILAPHLADERVTHATQVLVESAVGRLSASIVTGGLSPQSADELTGAFHPGGYLAVTPSRVFALGQTAGRARPKDLVFAIDRAGLSCTRGTKRLMGVVKLPTLTLEQEGFTIMFHIPKNAKADGSAVMDELGA